MQSGESWVLVDTAWRGRAELIRSAAETLFGAGARPRAIVLTHVHPDHAGSASELARVWDVTVYVHPGELPLPPSGRIIGALAGVERRWMFPSGQGGLSSIDPDAGVPGLPDWQVIPTPGHTHGHLALFREADRALIAGDAVLTVNLNSPADALSQRHTLGGPPRFATWNWRAATEPVSELARLEPGVLAPGHGRPMTGPVPTTSSRPGDASHSRTPGPLTAPGTSSTLLPGFLARFPAIFRVLGLDIPWVWVGPESSRAPQTTRYSRARRRGSG